MNKGALCRWILKLPDVSIEHPVHFSRSDSYRQRVPRLMRAAPRPESVRESQEVLFEDRVQYLDGGALDHFVFQCGNAEWAKLTRFPHLRDVHSTNWSCSVGSSLEFLGEILEVRLEIL